MLGEKYFQDKYAGIYDLCPIKYEYGTGIISYKSSDDKENKENKDDKEDKKYSVDWEFVASITGESTFVIHYNGFFLPNEFDADIKFNGETHCKNWDVKCDNIKLISQTISTFDKTISHYIVHDFCFIKKGINIQDINYVEGSILNFDFLGTEITKTDLRIAYDHFTVHIHNKDCQFYNLENNKEIKDLINLKRIDRAILSYVKIQIIKDENVKDIDQQLKLISNFLKFVNLNSCDYPIIQYYHDNTIYKKVYRNIVNSSFHRSVIVNNINSGLPQIFNDCYANFCNLDQKLYLSKFIPMLLGMREGKYLENKIINLLYCYDYFLMKILNLNDEELDLDIQTKIRLLNSRHLNNLIPLDKIADLTEKNIKNLILKDSQGYTTHADFYFKYLDLLIKIILFVLEYKGTYFSQIEWKAITLDNFQDYS